MKRIILFSIVMLLVSFSYSQSVWYPQNSGTNTVLFDVQFIDNFTGWICGNTGTILHTQDGGLNWQEQDPPPNNTYYGIYFADSENGYACGYGGKIIGTNDGGSTWTSQITNTSTYLYDIQFVDSQTGWAVGGDNGVFPSNITHRVVLHTSDGGNTWVDQLNQSDEKLLRSVYFIDENNGYAVGEGGEVIHTSDGGSNWMLQASFPSYDFRSVFFVDELKGWVISEYLGLPHAAVIFITTDGGLSWTEQVITEDHTLFNIFFIDENKGWAVGGDAQGSAIYYTLDGGTTWYEDDAGTTEYLYSIYFNDHDNGWIVGNGGTILSSSLPTGIETHEAFASISAFPNPASHKLSVQLETETDKTVNISLISTSGQIIYRSENLPVTGRTSLNVDVEAYKEGMYLLFIENNTDRIVEKIIIKR